MRRDTRDDVPALIQAIGPPPWTLDQVRAAGWSPAKIRRAVDAGRLVRPTRGVLVAPDDALSFRERTLLAARAALVVGTPGSVISHGTAAVLHRLWLPARTDALVHLTAPEASRRTDHGVRTHDFPLDGVVEILDGLPVTSIERTAIDVARGQPFAQALVVLDSAARALVARRNDVRRRLRDPVGRDALVGEVRKRFYPALDPFRGHPGTRVVGRALGFLDPCSESPFESTSRAHMIDGRLPVPLLAWPVRGASGQLYYADFAWPDRHVLGEADGWTKYGDGHEVRTQLAAERRRQRDLEAAGWTVVRWDPSDPPREVVARIRAALAA